MLAIIPARGGSVGLPNKNIKKFVDKPLIAHTILTAQKSKFISEIVVTTDSLKIANIAKKFGVKNPHIRSKKLASNNSMVMDTYFDVLNSYEKKTKKSIKSFIALLPTCPLRNKKHIDNAIKLFKKNKADSVISVTDAPIPPDWHKTINKDGKLSSFFKSANAVLNRQHTKKTYTPNGAIYIFKSSFLKKNRNYYGKKSYGFYMEQKYSIDIDDINDFKIGELFFKINAKF